MTDADRYARLAAQLLRTQPAQAQAEATDARRDQVVAAMALAVAEKRRRRRTIVAAGVAFAAAAAVLLLVKATGHKQTGKQTGKDTGSTAETTLLVEANTGSGNSLVRNALQKPLLDGARLVEGDSVEAEQNSSATLGFANGTRVTLSAAGRLRVDELAATRRFSLHRGHLEAHVAKLGQGERFVVDTPDAEVEVRGTVFGIAVAAAGDCPGLAVRSRVAVSEGAVWVRLGASQVLLKPGQSWASPCPDSPAAEAETRPSASSATPSGAARAMPSTHPPVHHAAAARPHTPSVPNEVAAALPPQLAPPAEVPVHRESHLAEQNGLFSSAIASEHQGDHATALRKLDDLIQRFPAGPLAESARAERQRILSAQPPR
jgi:ferric-dicitrate binding protein FerR (iron transport regulator)